MSGVRVYSLPKLGEQVRKVAAELAWRQWAALGRVAVASREARAIVDPEALLLLSLGLAEGDGRINRLIPWWAHVGARVLSVQRAKNLVAEYPAGAGAALGRFARSAVIQGGDQRWRAPTVGPAFPCTARHSNDAGYRDPPSPSWLSLGGLRDAAASRCRAIGSDRTGHPRDPWRTGHAGS
jgi:hypothetical protein